MKNNHRVAVFRMSQISAEFVLNKQSYRYRRLYTLLATEKHLTGGEILQLTSEREEFLKLRERTRMTLISETEDQHFKPE
jgi:hypothetical protein